ncbi:Ig-like domain-containing protein [Streptomyces sp. NBC_00249]|uniref:Ig-like domain-containing protein n=1 Tax=Streptomyces sp. NBC_00249 TaxID=2975690 RepID=UPI00225C267C|nr:Ig-like domain-containing protein [Streptomyces sp. NBC_00249]MCX5197361.1 Ig-like domain-containing protein [Streptomyces sp. NBC_00249]
MSFPLKRSAAAVATAVLGVVLAATGGQAHASLTTTAQAAPRASALGDSTSQVDRLWALEGDEQTVKAGQQVPVRLKVRAVNANHKPVEGATITFSTPGPGLKFPNGDDDTTVTTDKDGYATAPVLKATGQPGADLVTAHAGSKAQVAFEITIS